MLGTDNNHGGLPDDAAYLVELGAAPVTALMAATSLAAEAALLNDTVSIRPGFRADLIAVKGNPLEDIAVLKQICFVMKSGIQCDLTPV